MKWNCDLNTDRQRTDPNMFACLSRWHKICVHVPVNCPHSSSTITFNKTLVASARLHFLCVSFKYQWGSQWKSRRNNPTVSRIRTYITYSCSRLRVYPSISWRYKQDTINSITVFTSKMFKSLVNLVSTKTLIFISSNKILLVFICM